MKQKDKIIIYENLLISLHTASWTGNSELIKKIMDRIADFSYARTNSNEWDTNKDIKERYERTLKALDIHADERSQIH